MRNVFFLLIENRREKGLPLLFMIIIYYMEIVHLAIIYSALTNVSATMDTAYYQYSTSLQTCRNLHIQSVEICIYNYVSQSQYRY